MEDDAVVEPRAGELLDTLDVVGCLVGKHLDHDASILEVEIDHIFLFDCGSLGLEQ